MSISNNSAVAPVVVNFSSQNRESGSNENFFSNPITFKINSFDSVCLLQASVPKSAYNITPPYNTFNLTEGATTVTVTIPPASYSAQNLVPTLTASLNAASPNGWTYSVFYNSPTWHCGDPDIFKYQFNVTGNGGVQPILSFGIFSMEKPLGFNKNSSTSFVGDQLYSTNCVNLANITRCFIKSNIVINSFLSILEEVLNYGDWGPLQQCYYQQYSVDLNSREFNNSGVNSWQFILVDANDAIIDLNGVPWSFSLVFYQRNNLHELQGLEMKIQNELRILDLQGQQEQLIKQVDSKGKLIDLELNKTQPEIPVSSPQEVTTLDPINEAVKGRLPVFPVRAFGSSSIVRDITLDSDEFPSAIKINQPVEEELSPDLTEEVIEPGPGDDFAEEVINP